MSVNTQPIYINKVIYNDYQKSNPINIPLQCKRSNIPEHPNNTPDDNTWLIKLNKRIDNYNNNSNYNLYNSNNFNIM